MDLLEDVSTRAHSGAIYHRRDRGSISRQELSIHGANCPCLSTVLTPP